MAHPSHSQRLQTLLERALADVPPGRCVWVALSGGMDSALLLTLAAELCRARGRPLRALHINHGLQAAAADFEHRCRALCRELGVPLTVARVAVDALGRGVEGAARKARYAAFVEQVPAGDTLMLAQHRRDQAETWLLAAMRGSGVRGLGAMPERRVFHGITLARPWLEAEHGALADAARALAGEGRLDWCDDPTNADTRFERNYLRHRVLPALKARWPHAERSLAAAALHMQDADALLEAYAAEELATLQVGAEQLDAAALAGRSRGRQRLLVRTFCRQQGLATPPQKRLETLLAQLGAAADAQAHVTWPGGCARLWRGRLYLLPEEHQAAAPDWRSAWDGCAPLATPLGEVDVQLKAGAEGAALPLIASWRRGGEVIRLAGRGRRDLKRLLAEAGVPPWERHTIIVVWAEEACVAAIKAPDTLLYQAAGWRFAPARQAAR
ncbi:tRNA lysidine(34) synthetase TilS [Halomonas piscis]|uniref:tRNA(Ile)-lysidine synthase n=1 Tax=Halomonas piscis TaxID=3031727 RepID=A0ABY9Z0X7_9GAMM|nr:tRNA lysidine(34) synthetase TilS [Halomonas piscis]WNK20778.1 tRNA lysidine(34) synthetase TilS [Halomonas piscis]